MATNTGDAASYYNQQSVPPPIPYHTQPGRGGDYSGNGPENPQSNDQQVPPPYNAPPLDLKEDPPSYEEVFPITKPKWNDLWAAILFLVTCAGFVVVSAISIQGYASTRSENAGGINNQLNTFSLTTHTIWLFLWVLLAAVTLSYGYMWLARRFTKQFVWVTGILNIALGFITAIYMLVRRYWSGGIVFLLFSVFMLLCFLSWRSRIPFSVLMLQTAIDVAKKFGHVYTVSAVGGITATAFAGWYSVTLVAIYVKYAPSTSNPACNEGVGGCSWGNVTGLVAVVTFCGYWISEVLKNVVHTTISGVYGSWYFRSNSYPTRVTRGALRRSMTYSFGSICFGSLAVAVVNFLRQLASVARQQAMAGGDMLATVLFCVVGCIISILDWAIQFLNRYAFSHIALYGKAYIPAAKDTWTMIKSRGIDALINECLIGPVLGMGATFVGYACALLGYLYLVYTAPAYNADGSFTPVVVAFSFLIGLQICAIFTTPLSSGIDTIFVASAWDPEVLMRDHPDLYDAMVRVYPQVQEAIHA